MKNLELKPHKPYLVMAFKDWLEDNNLGVVALFIAKDTTAKIPSSFICEETGTAKLDISSDSVKNFSFDGATLSFNKIVNGNFEHISIPLDLVLKLSPIDIKYDDVSLPFEVSDNIISKYQKEKGVTKLRLVK